MIKVCTPEIDELIISYIQQYPDNITKGLKLLAKKTGIKYGTLVNRWYKVLSKKTKCFCLMTSKGKRIDNRKNVKINSLKEQLKILATTIDNIVQILERL